MNKSFSVVSAILVSAFLANGCATYGGYTPVVDSYGDPNAARLPVDQQECEMIAKEAASTGTESLKGAGAGALLGAAAGAAIGAVTGNPGKGAALGAAAGGIGGGAYKGYDSDESYRRAFSNCLRNRGHKVVQ